MNDIIKQKLDDYLLEMKAVDESEIPQVREKFSKWYNSMSLEEKKQMEPFWQNVKETARKNIREIKSTLNEIQTLNDVKIVVAGAVYDLQDWITISDYSRIHNLKVSRVQNWISRGVVPREKVLIISQLNNVKLIKNEIYRNGV